MGSKRKQKLKTLEDGDEVVDVETVGDQILQKQVAGKKRKRAPRPKVKCVHCGYSSRNTDHISDHVLNYHLRIKTYPCDDCEMNFPSKKMLSRHKRERLTKQQCNICSYTCTSDRAMKCHKSHHHTKCPWTCSSCAFASKSEEALQEHIINAHNQTKRFVCGICGYRSSTRGLIKVHTIKKHLTSIHKEIKPSLILQP